MSRYPALLLLLIACQVAGASSSQRLITEPHQIKDVYYGTSLYYFFQNRFFTSITELLKAKQQDQLTHHRDEAELLLGGLYLSYGMYSEAEKVFRRLLDQLTEPEIQTSAWFELAEVFYEKGRLSDSLNALNEVDTRKNPELEARKRLLAATIHMRQKNLKQAIAILRDTPGGSVWAYYGRYNLGIALIKSGQTQAGAEVLDQLGTLQTTRAELLALKDKANLALGYTLLRAQRPEQAEQFFARIRIKGAFANQAMFGIGQALAQQHRYEDALKFWLELKSRDRRGAAVYEAMLASAQAYFKLGAVAQAVDSYESAMRVFREEIDKLDETIAELHNTSLLDRMLERDVVDELAWLWRPRAIPDPLRHHFITTLLASHRFNSALKNYRDMLFFANLLQKRKTDMAAFDSMLETRRIAFEKKLPVIRARAEQLANIEISSRFLELQQRVTDLRSKEDALALARTHELALLDKLHRIDRRLTRVATQLDPDQRRQLEDQARRLRGVLHWRIRTDYRPRLRVVEKQLSELTSAMQQVTQRQEALRIAQEKTPLEFQGFEAVNATLRRRIDDLQQRLVKMMTQQRALIQGIALRRLEQQKRKLQRYYDNAEFALAQIYDAATP